MWWHFLKCKFSEYQKMLAHILQLMWEAQSLDSRESCVIFWAGNRLCERIFCSIRFFHLLLYRRTISRFKPQVRWKCLGRSFIETLWASQTQLHVFAWFSSPYSSCYISLVSLGTNCIVEFGPKERWSNHNTSNIASTC